MTETFTGSVLPSIIAILDFILYAYMWIIIVTALMSWVSPDPYNPIVRFLYRVTEPVLYPIRRMVGNWLGPIDIAPLIAVLIIMLIQKLLAMLLLKIAYTIN